MRIENSENNAIIRQMIGRLFPMQFFIAVMPALNSLISGILIGNFSPKIALSAISFTSPIGYIILACTDLVKDGGNILCNRALGYCNTEKMNRYFSASMFLLFLLGTFLTLTALIFAAPIVSLLGATDKALDYTVDYLRGLSIGYIPTLLASGFVIFLPIANDTASSIYSSVILVASDLLLGFLNATLLRGNMFGMGLANSLSELIICIFLWVRFHSKQSSLYFSLKKNLPHDIVDILKLGIPGCLLSLLNGFEQAIIVLLIAMFGDDMSTSVYAIYSSAFLFFCSPEFAIRCVTSILFSVYYDIKDYNSQKHVLRSLNIFGFVSSLIPCVFLFIFWKPISILFGATSELFSSTKILLSILSIYIMVCFPQMILMATHESMGHVKFLNIANTFVTCILPISIAYSLGNLIGIHGVWIGGTLSDFSILFLYYFYAYHKRGKAPKSLEEACLVEKPDDKAVCINLTIHTMDEVARVSQNVIAFCHENGIDAKRSYLCGLCLEELSGNIVAHGFSQSKRKDNHIDIFLRILDGEILVRLCDNAPGFDPMRKLGAQDASDPMKNFGIRMVRRVAKTMEYKPTYGMNVISITL